MENFSSEIQYENIKDNSDDIDKLSINSLKHISEQRKNTNEEVKPINLNKYHDLAAAIGGSLLEEDEDYLNAPDKDIYKKHLQDRLKSDYDQATSLDKIDLISNLPLEQLIILFNSNAFNNEARSALNGELDRLSGEISHGATTHPNNLYRIANQYAIKNMPEYAYIDHAYADISQKDREKLGKFLPDIHNAMDYEEATNVLLAYEFAKRLIATKSPNLPNEDKDQELVKETTTALIDGASNCVRHQDKANYFFTAGILAPQIKNKDDRRLLMDNGCSTTLIKDFFRISDGEVFEKALHLEHYCKQLSSDFAWLSCCPAEIINAAYEEFQESHNQLVTREVATKEFIKLACRDSKDFTPSHHPESISRSDFEANYQLANLPHLIRLYNNGCVVQNYKALKHLDTMISNDDEVHFGSKYYGILLGETSADLIEMIANSDTPPRVRLSTFLKWQQEMHDDTKSMQTIGQFLAAPESKWLQIDSAEDRLLTSSFPYEQRESAKYAWCANYSFVPLRNDWGKQSIGKFLYTRLQNGVVNSLHDASMIFKTFDPDSIENNIEFIKSQQQNGVPPDEILNDDDNRWMNLYLSMSNEDEFNRESFFNQIISVPDTQRKLIRLNTKSEKLNSFDGLEDKFAYYIISKYYSVAKTQQELSDLMMRNILKDYEEFSLSFDPKHKKFFEDDEVKSHILEYIEERLDDSKTTATTAKEVSLGLQELAKYDHNRRKYIDDATRFLTRHMMVPNDELVSAWSMRPEALANGIPDRVSEIIAWSKERGIGEQYDAYSEHYQKIGLTREDVTIKYAGFARELFRCYDSKRVLNALASYKKLPDSPKTLPANEIRLKYEKDDKDYVGTVLARNDPRGMTIGYDTGCCMTLDGASESCIWSGYKDPNVGFFALYEGNGKIMAQSYFYTNPEHPEILVMDNIESNAGRGADKIMDLYDQYFREYLLDRFQKDPNWQIREVHIGTQYGELVKPIVDRLNEAEIILNPDQSVYTDAANDQRLLFRLTDEEIAKAREGLVVTPGQNEPKLIPTHETSEHTSPLSIDQAETLTYLESELYPPEMRQYGDPDFLYSELNQPGVGDYSFIINSQTDANHTPVGYCLAYEAESETDPSFTGKNLYIADFGILRGNRGFSAAINSLDEVLNRAKAHNVDQIEMDARESTSYKLLTSNFGKRLLARRGYSLTEFDTSNDFGNGEVTHLLRLTKAA